MPLGDHACRVYSNFWDWWLFFTRKETELYTLLRSCIKSAEIVCCPRAKLYPEVPSSTSFTPELSRSKDCFESKTCSKIRCLLSCNDATPVNNLGPYTSNSEYSTKHASQASSTLLLRVFAGPWQFYPIFLKNPSSDFLKNGIRRAGAIFVYLLVRQEAPADRRT